LVPLESDAAANLASPRPAREPRGAAGHLAPRLRSSPQRCRRGATPSPRETVYAELRVDSDGAVLREPSSVVIPSGALRLQRRYVDPSQGPPGDVEAKGLFVRLEDNWYVVRPALP
jgi:hypothetical protein